MEPTLQLRGKLVAVCRSERKHVAKEEVPDAIVRENHGLEGDAHAGPEHRQVSMIDTIQTTLVREKGGESRFGAFGENFVVDGIDLRQVSPGSILRLGKDVVVEVTQIGKVCHDRCAIYQQVGDCPMSSEGVFARVICGGKVAAGDPVVVEKLVGRQTPQCAIVVVSDRCFRGETVDTAGELLKRILLEGGSNVLEKTIVPDEADAIAAALIHLCDERGADVIFTSGGTGMAPRDVTPEATRRVLEREVPGIGEAVRMTTMSRSPRSILSRGVSGIRGRTLIVNLPGSEKGVQESIAVILPIIGHAVETLRGVVKDCGR